jgi:ferritin-like metal-binding protein YciE
MKNGKHTNQDHVSGQGPSTKNMSPHDMKDMTPVDTKNMTPGGTKSVAPRDMKGMASHDMKIVAPRDTKDKAPLESTVESLKKLYEEDLKDIYWAENHLLGVLPRMASAAESPELRSAFEDHLAQTKNHVSRLKHVFESSGLKVSAKKCEAMDGLTKEGDEVIEGHAKGCVRDTGLIIAGQKVEHYEIAAYGSLRTLAQVLKLDEAAGVLQETLDEEGNANRLLTGLSRTINEQALNQVGVVR